MKYYFLEIVSGIENGKRYKIAEGASSIGRNSDNMVVLHSAEKSVSGHHAILYISSDSIIIQDLQSTNGTYVNENRISEQTITENDIIGLGRKGPRLKLIISDSDLPSNQQTNIPNKTIFPTSMRTIEEEEVNVELNPFTSEATSKESLDAITKIRLEQQKREQSDYNDLSLTAKLERKLADKSITGKDMEVLFKDGKRVKKIIERANLGTTQITMLNAAYAASRKSKSRWVAIVAAVVFVSVMIVLYYSVRMHQYKNILSRGLSLEQKLDKYESQIVQAQKKGTSGEEELKTLIAELEKTKKELAEVKQNIRLADEEKFYKDPLEKILDNILRRFGENDYHIPEQMVARVRHYLDMYSGPMRDIIMRYLIRKQKYYSMIVRILQENKLPPDLVYVAMNESGFNYMALSKAGARGLWQFMPATARRYKLRVDDYVDERTDPVKSTYAAAEYLKDLIGIFGGKSSVMLAMAAYNAGEGRIMNALRKIEDPLRNRDFWYIYRMGYLAEETNEYIPRILALLIISENTKAYGFDNIPADVNYKEVESERDFYEWEQTKSSSAAEPNYFDEETK